MWVKSISILVAAFAVAGCQSQAELQPRMQVDMAARPSLEPEIIEAPRVDAKAHAASGRARDEIGRVTVMGGAVEDAPQVAAAMMPGFHRCKMRWSPKSEGEMQVSAKIGPVGEVRIATPESDRMPPMLVACVRAKVASAKFAAPTGTDPTVVIPIRFVID